MTRLGDAPVPWEGVVREKIMRSQGGSEKNWKKWIAVLGVLVVGVAATAWWVRSESTQGSSALEIQTKKSEIAQQPKKSTQEQVVGSIAVTPLVLETLDAIEQEEDLESEIAAEKVDEEALLTEYAKNLEVVEQSYDESEF